MTAILLIFTSDPVNLLRLLSRAHAQGVKQSGFFPSVCQLKIARSGDLGVIARSKYNYRYGKVGKRTFFSLLGA